MPRKKKTKEKTTKPETITRAITLPIVSPVDCDWKELREFCGDAWKQSTRMANYMVSEFAKADIVRTPGMEKLPPMEYKNWYPVGRAFIPEMDTRSLCSLQNGLLGKYRKARFNMIWLGEESLPSFRYPYPYPFKGESLKYLLNDQGQPIVSLRLGGKRIQVRLANGPEWHRQMDTYKRIASGEFKGCEASLIRRRASTGGHRNGTTEKPAGGGNTVHYRVMLKIVYKRPPCEDLGRRGMWTIRTSGRKFVESIGAGRPFNVNARHVKRWIILHEKDRQALSEDLKFEKRWPKANRRRMVEAGRKRCEKHHNRIDTWIHQITSILVNYADRNRFEAVRLDASDRSYFDLFPWSKFETVLQYKLEERGIEFDSAYNLSRGNHGVNQ